MTKGDLLRLWALLDELEDLIRLSPFHELVDAINVTRRRIVELGDKWRNVRWHE